MTITTNAIRATKATTATKTMAMPNATSLADGMLMIPNIRFRLRLVPTHSGIGVSANSLPTQQDVLQLVENDAREPVETQTIGKAKRGQVCFVNQRHNSPALARLIMVRKDAFHCFRGETFSLVGGINGPCSFRELFEL